jgi:ATP-dependent DNA helicase RecG
MRDGVRASRDQLLKDTMRDLGYVDHMGFGVPREIVAGMRAHNGSEPDLVEQQERFLVRLWA